MALGEDVTLEGLLWLDGTIVAANGYDSSVVVVDPSAGVTATVPREDVVFRAVADEGTAWFSGFGGVFGYDATGAKVQPFGSDSEVTAIAADPESDAMWAGYFDGTVATLDGATGEYGPPVTVGDDYVGDLQYVDGVLWASIEDGSLYRLDPATLEVLSEVALPGAEGQAALAIG